MNDRKQTSESIGEQLSFLSVETDMPVKGLQPEDILLPPEKPKKKRNTAVNIIQIALLFIFGSIFVVCAIYIGFSHLNKLEGGQLYGDIADEFPVFGDTSSDVLYSAQPAAISDSPMQNLDSRLKSGSTDSLYSSENDLRLSAVYDSLSKLKEQNSDTYGWIYIEGTNINYPVMRGTDNSYYLTHSIKKEYLAVGTVFADYQCAESIKDNYNTVFYGHNVVTTVAASSMFHDVEKFLDETFFNETLIYVYTLDGIFVYKPFSIYSTISDYEYFKASFADEEEFLSYAEDYKENSRLSSDIEVVEDDRILTLSTCTNGPKNARYALHAILVETIE